MGCPNPRVVEPPVVAHGDMCAIQTSHGQQNVLDSCCASQARIRWRRLFFLRYSTAVGHVQ
jgi:hypothetical protein